MNKAPLGLLFSILVALIFLSGFFSSSSIAMWGTSGFVKSEVEQNKRLYPLSSLILDRKGVGRESWQLQKKTSSIVVTDRQGTAIYVKHGALDENDIEQTLDLIRAQVNS